MNLFIDSSAVLAMLHRESDALDLADRLDEAENLLWGPLVVWETSVVLARLRAIEIASARGDVFEFGRQWAISPVTIGDWETELAIEAFKLYGKGTGHPAQLNMGDCFSYACAKANQARLLYKGKDFAHTDLA